MTQANSDSHEQVRLRTRHHARDIAVREEYAILGYLFAAKHTTGPLGARREWRIASAMCLSDEATARHLQSLIDRGWVGSEDLITGRYFYVVRPDGF